MRTIIYIIIILILIAQQGFAQFKNEVYCTNNIVESIHIPKSSTDIFNKQFGLDFFDEEDNMNFGKRFIYSQKILWPSSIAGHIGLYIISSRPVTWSMFSFQTIKESFTKLPIIEKDPWVYNYMVHPIMGSFSYLAFRNRGGSWWESLIGTCINSTIYEYIIASSTQRPSAIDLSVTPIGGAIIGEGIFQLKRHFIHDNYLNLLEKIIITIIDPFEILHVGFKYHRLIN